MTVVKFMRMVKATVKGSNFFKYFFVYNTHFIVFLTIMNLTVCKIEYNRFLNC